MKSREKAKQTMLERHGAGHPMWVNKFKEKQKQTNLERHGAEHALQNNTILEKFKNTMLSRHGVHFPQQSSNILDKSKKTNMDKLGVPYSILADVVKTKAKNTLMIRHGVDNSFKSPAVKEKIKITNINKFGTENYANKHISLETQTLLNDKYWLIEQHKAKTITEIACELNVSGYTIYTRFKQFNIETKHHNQSFFEKQVFEFVKSIYTNITPNDRTQIKPYELDIWFHDLNMAIECNGRYYHQEEQKEINKFNLCKEKGIDLHFIWDDEWYADTEYWKQYITDSIKQKSPN